MGPFQSNKRAIAIAVLAMAAWAGALSAAPAVGKPARKAPAVASAPATVQALSVSAIELSLHGDSTLHKWEAKAAQLTLTAGLNAGKGTLPAALRGGDLASLTLTVEVDGLHSPEGKGMDGNMHKAMHSQDHPQVIFRLSGYGVEGDQVSGKGSLEINGVAKEAELKGVLSDEAGAVRFSGSFDLKMSDFGITPPVMMMGTVRTKDLVSVVYSFTLSKP